ncbi:odorant receptor 49b [Drosophila grimshawi]|uniref:Odorant receptor n=1 Tax=Drosophila grimshawi TaxID=7222 RepID=B4J6U3_DROGR|nr:odorant receptor 49b [Drosophila grimshawi]EDW02024.1 GH21764 [Drosophila grimshawi]
MLEDIQLVYMNVKILRFWALLYDKNVMRYVCFTLTTIHVLTQLLYILTTNEGLIGIIRNSYMLVLWINTLLRACLLLYDQQSYVQLINDLRCYYYELRRLHDPYISQLLSRVNRQGQIMARGNLFFGLLTCIGFGLYPLSSNERVLPFGSKLPGINEYATPYYQVWFCFHMLITPMGCCMYIPYTSLCVAFIMFGIVMCKALQHRLRSLGSRLLTKTQLSKEINECIIYHQRIIDYIQNINNLTTYIFLIEFLAFGALLCALLFMLMFVDSTAHVVIVSAYINMILAQILALYWFANELREQNLAIAVAAYDTEWFTFEIAVRKKLLFMILRAQRPASILLGNIRPITLELFQNLLNTTYTVFTVLKRIYG